MGGALAIERPQPPHDNTISMIEIAELESVPSLASSSKRKKKPRGVVHKFPNESPILEYHRFGKGWSKKTVSRVVSTA